MKIGICAGDTIYHFEYCWITANGFYADALFDSIVIIIAFYICQSNGGGYHADTHLKCFFTMVSGLLCGLILIKLQAPDIVYHVILFVSVTVLIALPLHLNPNKRYLMAQIPNLRKKSVIYTMVIMTVAVFSIWFNWVHLEHAISAGMFLSAFSRLYASFHEGL